MRMEILRQLDGREASPSELATLFGNSVGDVSYHVRALVDLGVVKLVRVRQVRGALEHFYTATVRITVTQELLDASRAESQSPST
jgi:DNA-binding transcriptional ArsR family regulator